MKRSSIGWVALVVVAAAYIIYRSATGGMGQVYVKGEPVVPKGYSEAQWTVYTEVAPRRRSEEGVSLSLPRTVGVWIAGFFTLCILSFLYGDNVLYKLAESVVVGASAAYAMVVGFWTGIIQNLFGKLTPDLIRESVAPGLKQPHPEYVYIFALILSAMMLMRLSPKGGWISRWPLAFFIGATSGIRMIAYLDSDFVKQIQSTLLPLMVATDGNLDGWGTAKNITILVGVLSCLVYFFFSIEHKGVVGGVARLGIWFLMVTFGAGFGYTVMGRIALISERFSFLFDDWLWLIDPTNARLGM